MANPMFSQPRSPYAEELFDTIMDEYLDLLLDEPVIDISYMVNYFCEMREKYGLNTIVGDTFRLDIVKQALEEAGFKVLYNPHAIYAKLAPRIEIQFP
ncbi:hypothetical protein [Peribacillus simplex]|uniref:hypothetical protein n=1 Tax=Peribacillus simplex TaxID=1478 RepID=UPI00399C1388